MSAGRAYLLCDAERTGEGVPEDTPAAAQTRASPAASQSTVRPNSDRGRKTLMAADFATTVEIGLSRPVAPDAQTRCLCVRCMECDELKFAGRPNMHACRVMRRGACL